MRVHPAAAEKKMEQQQEQEDDAAIPNASGRPSVRVEDHYEGEDASASGDIGGLARLCVLGGELGELGAVRWRGDHTTGSVGSHDGKSTVGAVWDDNIDVLEPLIVCDVVDSVSMHTTLHVINTVNGETQRIKFITRLMAAAKSRNQPNLGHCMAPLQWTSSENTPIILRYSPLSSCSHIHCVSISKYETTTTGYPMVGTSLAPPKLLLKQLSSSYSTHIPCRHCSPTLNESPSFHLTQRRNV